MLDLRAIRGRSILIPGLMLGTHIRFTRPQTHPRRWPPQPAATLIELILVPCVVGDAARTLRYLGRERHFLLADSGWTAARPFRDHFLLRWARLSRGPAHVRCLKHPDVSVLRSTIYLGCHLGHLDCSVSPPAPPPNGYKIIQPRQLLVVSCYCMAAPRERAFRSTIQFDPAQRCGVVTLFRYRERPAAGGGRCGTRSTP